METDLPLRDIHLPDPIGWWPPAPGWWILLFGGVVLMWTLLWLWRRIRRTTVKTLALRELETIMQSSLDAQAKVQQIAILLRRISLSVYPRDEVAGLTGVEWLEFLDRTLTGKQRTKPARSSRLSPGEGAPDGRMKQRDFTVEGYRLQPADPNDSGQNGQPGPTRPGLSEKARNEPGDQADPPARGPKTSADCFREGSGRLLINAPYRREVREDLHLLFALCRRWIEHLPDPVKGKVTAKALPSGGKTANPR